MVRLTLDVYSWWREYISDFNSGPSAPQLTRNLTGSPRSGTGNTLTRPSSSGGGRPPTLARLSLGRRPSTAGGTRRDSASDSSLFGSSPGGTGAGNGGSATSRIRKANSGSFPFLLLSKDMQHLSLCPVNHEGRMGLSEGSRHCFYRSVSADVRWVNQLELVCKSKEGRKNKTSS